MKSLIASLLFLFTFIHVLICQTNISTSADIIVEGQVISATPKWSNDRSHIVTESKIKVISLFKGNVSDSILTITTFGGEIDDDLHFSPHSVNLHKDYQGYFFLRNNLDFVDNENGFAYLNSDLNRKVRINGKLQDQEVFEENIIKETKFPKLSISDYFNYIKNVEIRDIDTCNVISSVRNNKTIKFSFRNVKYTGNFQYLEFDIKAKVNTPGLKFGKGNLYVKYSKQFGKNVIANNTVQVTKGAIIQNALYNLTSVDIDSQRFKISILPQYSSNNMFTFSESEEDLAHVKIKIADFTSIGSISFADIDISGEVFYWCQGTYGLFDETNLSAPITAINANAGNTVSLTYTFENPSSINNNTEYQFDIYASASSTTNFSLGYVYVTYSSLGLKPYSNADVSLSRGEILMDNTTYNVEISGYTDYGFYIFSTPIGTVSPSNLFSLGSTPKKYVTINIKIKDCLENANLKFDESQMNSSGSTSTYYTGIFMPFPFTYYEPVIANDEEIGKICNCQKPIISSFSPANINAGLGEILTINGQNFGTFVPSKSTILFNNGDDMGPSEIEAGALDFKWDNIFHWSDTEIKIKVPSCDKNIGTKQGPSTGKLKIKNSCETSDESITNLEIPYSIFNYRSIANAEARRINLQSNSSDNSICFKFSNELPSWVYNVFYNALQDWCAATGVNFYLGGTINKNTPYGEVDGINLISYEDGTGAGLLSSSNYYKSNKCSTNEFYFSELDIVLRGPVTEPSDGGLIKKRIRDACLHELGHAHMLQHARGFDQLMGPSSNVGSITSYDLTGANLVFTSSSACGNNPIGRGSCSASCLTNTFNFNSTIDFIISPNPVLNFVTILPLDISIDKVEIISSKGIILNHSYQLKSHTVDVSAFPSGIYTCRIFSNKEIFNRTFIKI